MTLAPGVRAVVFDLRDLPEEDALYLHRAAAALGLSLTNETTLFQTPLLLVRGDQAPPVPGLRGDAEVAVSGLSGLLLAMRLIEADVLSSSWPELRFLGLDPRSRTTDCTDFALYAADPKTWTTQSLAAALGRPNQAQSSALLQCGLLPRAKRWPPCPGDRIPVLGFQVPMFGGHPETNTRCLTASPPLPSALASLQLPADLLIGHQQGARALFLQLEHLELSDGQAAVDLTLLVATTPPQSAPQLSRQPLRLTLSELSTIYDAEGSQQAVTLAVLRDWLEDLLPCCFLTTDTGSILLLDWFQLGLQVLPQEAAQPAEAATILALGSPQLVAATEEGSDAEPQLLSPQQWGLERLADLLRTAELVVSTDAQTLTVESTLVQDDFEQSFSAVLDLTPPGGPQVLRASLYETPVAALPHDDSAATTLA